MERLTKSLRLLSYSAGKLLSPAPWSPLGAKVLSRKEYSSEAPEPLELSFDLYTGENPETRPPLVTYHGLFGSKQNWRGISRALVRKVPRKVGHLALHGFTSYNIKEFLPIGVCN